MRVKQPIDTDGLRAKQSAATRSQPLNVSPTPATNFRRCSLSLRPELRRSEARGRNVVSRTRRLGRLANVIDGTVRTDAEDDQCRDEVASSWFH